MIKTLSKTTGDEENFFLTEEEKNDLNEGKGFEDVNMND